MPEDGYWTTEGMLATRTVETARSPLSAYAASWARMQREAPFVGTEVYALSVTAGDDAAALPPAPA